MEDLNNQNVPSTPNVPTTPNVPNMTPAPAKKSMVGLLVIILIIIIVAGGGYFVYTNYFSGQGVQTNDSQEQPVVTKGPKAAFVECLTKSMQATTLEEAFNATVGCEYFATVEDREELVTETIAQIQKLTDEEKAQQFSTMKTAVFQPLIDEAPGLVETINGQDATLEKIEADGTRTRVATMKNDGGVWKIVP